MGCDKAVKIIRADIYVTEAPNGKLVKVHKTITDQDELQRLANFFPHAGEGRKSAIAGGWGAWAGVKFTCSDGKVITIWTDYNSWTEGQGDWPAAPGFSKYIESMLKETTSKQAN